MNLRLIVTGFLAALLMSCATVRFEYEAQPPLSMGGQVKEFKKTIYGDATGFLWNECIKVNDEAIDNLKSKLKPNERVFDLEWLDGRGWSPTPSCRKQWGWVATVYFFWVPWATQAHVRGKVVDVADVNRPKEQ